MTIGKLAIAVLAASLALGSGIAALDDDPRTSHVRSIDLNDQDGTLRRDDAADDVVAIDDDDDDFAGDGDRTRGNDGTNGGNNTGDGDRTGGNDGTDGGNNIGDGDATDGNDRTAGGDNTYSPAGDGDTADSNSNTN